MKQKITLGSLISFMLLLTGLARGQTITNVTLSSGPYCAGNNVTVTIVYNGFPTGSRTFNIEAYDENATTPTPTLFTTTVTGAGNATTVSKAVTLSSSAVAGAYTIKVTSVADPTKIFNSSVFLVGVTPTRTNSTSGNFVCSGGTFTKDLQALISNEVASNFSWTAGTPNPAGSITGAADGSDPLTLSQTLTTSAVSGNPFINFTVTPTSEIGGCVGSNITVRVYVAKVENGGAFGTPSKTICSGAASETIPTIAGTVLVGSSQATASYQWQRNSGSGFQNIEGATATTFTENDPLVLTNTSGAAKTYTYQRIVYLGNENCSGTTTNSYSLTVMSAISGGIIIPPTPSTFCSGASSGTLNGAGVDFGGAASAYLWQSKTTGNYSTATGTSDGQVYELPTNLTADRTYRRVATATLNGTSCTANSNEVTIVINNVTAGNLTGNQQLCSSDTPVELANNDPTGDGDLTYEWHRTPTNGFATYDVVGTNKTYIPESLAGRRFYRRVTKSTFNGVACEATTSTSWVSVNAIEPGTISGGSTAVCSGGDPAAFTSTAAGTASSTASYQWQSKTGAGDWTDIAAAGTGATYDPPVGLTETTMYHRKTMGAATSVYKACEAVSNELTVTVNPVPNASAMAEFNAICSGQTVNIDVQNPNSVTGAKFNWTATYNGATGGAGTGTGVSFGSTAISEALVNTTSSPIVVTYSITPVGPAPTNCAGVAIPVQVTVNPVPTAAVLSRTSANPMCEGGNLDMKVDITGGTTPFKVTTAQIITSPTGIVITSNYASGATITRGPLMASASTNNYILMEVEDANGCKVPIANLSSTASVLVNKAPTLVTIARTDGYTGQICRSSTPIEFSATLAGGSGTPTYAWTAASPAAPATGTSATFSPVWSSGSGNRDVNLSVSVAGCPTPVASNTFTVNLNAQPTVTITGTPSSPVCEGTTLNLTADRTGGIGPASTRSFAWYVSTDGGDMFVPAGNTTNSYSPSATFSTGGTVYQVVLSYPTGSNCATVSHQVPVVILQRPSASATATASAICSGTAAKISVTNPNAVSGATFKWTATYGAVTGGVGSGTGVAFGTNAINETLVNATSNPVTVTYTITPVGPGAAACEGAPQTVNITVNPLPIATITPSGPTTFCELQSVTLTAPAAASYLWSTSATTQAITVGTAGNYTVTITDANGCVSLPSAATTITVNPRPASFVITAGGPTTFCEGGSVTLTAPTVPQGSSIQWSNSLTTPSITVNSSGTYGLTMTNEFGCTRSADVSVTVNALPMERQVSGGGTSYCGAMVRIYVSNSQSGITYNLKRGTTVVASLGGTGYTTYFQVNQAGTYTVEGVSSAGCTRMMSGSVTVTEATIATYTVSGGGVSCDGEYKHITLSGSQVGVLYELYKGGVHVDDMDGTGSPITFLYANLTGNYTVVAFAGDCTPKTMSGAVTVTASTSPTSYNVTGGGCTNAIGLSGSQTGISYQLFRGGSPQSSTAVGTSVSGTGNALSMGSHTVLGTYWVKATNALGCETWMSGNAIINPSPTVFTVSGGGISCGSSGKEIQLSGSQLGFNYYLQLGPNQVEMKAGTGSALVFGPQSSAGTYTVVAVAGGGGCPPVAMNGSANISSSPLPNTFAMTGNSCNGSAIGLSGSQTGVSYQLYRDGNAVGTSVTGTGNALSLGSHTVAGIYTVKAVSAAGCVSEMGSIKMGPAQTKFTVSGGGLICSGTVTVQLSGSQTGVWYHLKSGTTFLGSLEGTGSALSFVFIFSAAGTYTIETDCGTKMNGSATTSAAPAAPNTYSMTGGGPYCSTAVPLGLSGSQTGKAYQLQRENGPNWVNVGSTISGTGNAISLGSHTTLGTYRVIVTTTCGVVEMGTKRITSCPTREAAEVLTDVTPEEWATLAANPVTTQQASMWIRNQANKTVRWSLTNLQGGLLKNGAVTPATNNHREDINMTSVQSGMYLMIVESEGKRLSLKLIKE